VTTDRAGLLADATDAFVDRTPIDWRALRAMAQDPRDRALVDTLHTIEQLRRSAAPTVRPRESLRRELVVRGIIVLAALQTIASLLLAAPSPGGGDSLRTAAQVALALSFTTAAAVVGFGAARDARRLYLIGMLLCCASAFARAALPASPTEDARGLWLEVFAPACMWQFALDFPRVQRFSGFDVLARRVAALVWLLSTAAFALNLAVVSGLVRASDVAAFVPTHGSNLFWRAHTAAMILAVLSTFIRSRRAPETERRKVMRFASALALGGAPFHLLGTARTLIPALDRWLISAPPHARLWLDAIVVGALLAMPILVSVAVVVDRPFGVQRVVADAWRRLGRKAQFWRPRRHRREISTALQRLRGARGTRDIGRIAAQAIASGLDAGRVRVLVPAPATFAECTGSSTSAPARAAFVAMLRESGHAVDLSPDRDVRALLPVDERAWLAAQSIHVAAPIFGRSAAPAAIIVAGKPDAVLRLDRHDLWFVNVIAAAASSAWSAVQNRHGDDGSIGTPTENELAFECPGCGIVAASLPLSCACGRAPVLAALPARVGASLVVGRRLGAGGMGVAYLARDGRLDRDVALKTLPSIGRSAAKRLETEARTMAAISHEGLATIYGLEMWRDVPVLVVEYFPAGTLAQRLAASGPLSADAVIRLGIALVRALDVMHAAGLLHGDIKPSNIGFTGRGDAKLLDFGLSRLAGEDPNDFTRRPAAGTLAYLPPEALRGEAPRTSFDLWSLAITLLEAVTGRNPFVHGSAASTVRHIITSGLTSGNSELYGPAAGVHPELAALLRRALGPEPMRFQAAPQMLSALEAIADVRPR
jgi:hypothetical protein